MTVFEMISRMNFNPNQEKIDEVINLVTELFLLDKEAVAKFPCDENGYLEYRKAHSRMQEIIAKLDEHGIIAYDLFGNPYIDTESETYLTLFGECTKLSDIIKAE